MAKRTLFVGSSAPIGYDYGWSANETLASAEPFPVLEDLNGILLCYDELIFLSRAFCPRDLWELPYVSFVTDFVDLQARIDVAYEQARSAQYSFSDSVSIPFQDVVRRVASREALIDNHGRSVKITEQVSMMGNAGDIDQVLADMNIGASLQLENLDVLTNTFGTMRLRALSDAHADRETDGDVGENPYLQEHFLKDAVAPWHLAVASNVASLRIPNTYDPGRSYRPDIEDLRSHPNLRAFRDMLTQKEPDVLEAADAAREITEMAAQFAHRQLAKNFTKKPWYHSWGRLAIGPAGNVIHPGLGSAVAGSIKVMEYLRGGEERAVGSWAAFVSSLESSV